MLLRTRGLHCLKEKRHEEQNPSIWLDQSAQITCNPGTSSDACQLPRLQPGALKPGGSWMAATFELSNGDLQVATGFPVVGPGWCGLHTAPMGLVIVRPTARLETRTKESLELASDTCHNPVMML